MMYARVYRHNDTVAHLVRADNPRIGTGSAHTVCNIMAWPGYWYGHQTEQEADHAAALPLCRGCCAGAHTEPAESPLPENGKDV